MGKTPTTESVTADAVANLTSVANAAVETAQAHANSISEAQTNLDEALAAAQAANASIVALGGDPIDLSSFGVKGGRGRRKGSGSRSSGTSSRSSGSSGTNARSQNPYDLPTSVLIVMAEQRVGSHFRNADVLEALQSGGYQTSAQPKSFSTQITQTLTRLASGEDGAAADEIPAGLVEKVERGVYALTSEGKKYVKGMSLSDVAETE